MKGASCSTRYLRKRLCRRLKNHRKCSVTALSLLKKFHHSTKPAKIKANIADLQLLRSLYGAIEPTLLALGLTDEGLRYYANSVIKAEIFQVSRRAAPDRHLHLLAFIAYQTFKLHDLLIDACLQSVQSTLNTTAREHKELYYTSRVERRKTLNEIIIDPDQSVIAAFTDIQTIIAAEDFSAPEKIVMINDLLQERGAERERLAAQLEQLKSVAESDAEDADYYALLGKKSLKLQNRVSDIVRSVSFNTATAPPELAEAIRHFQHKSGEIEGNAPLAFHSTHERKMIFDEADKFRISLYRALLFIKIADALARELDRQYHHTNCRWLAGENQLLKLHPDGAFHLITPKEEESESSSLLPFFPERQYVSLVEVLATVQRATRFLDEFEHWQLKYRRERPPERTFFAVISQGCVQLVRGDVAAIDEPCACAA